MAEAVTAEERAAGRRAFLDRAGWTGAEIEALPADASFRRYFRVRRGGDSAILMDAPPGKEDVRPFLEIDRILAGYGYSVPTVLAEDAAAGFLLLEDLGDTTYTRALAAGRDERALYGLATDLLADLAARPVDPVRGRMPAYSDAKLLDEATLFVDWYLVRGVGLAIPDEAREAYREAWRRCLPVARLSPEVLVLRDYHVDNMMVLDGRTGIAACGLLDFQDAVVGPASYDLVSLLQDSRRDIAGDLADEMFARYLARLAEAGRPIADEEGFRASYLALGAQRALKVFGIFARQSVLYGNHRYLVHIPRLWRLTLADLAHPALAPVAGWIAEHVPESHRVVPPPGGRTA